MRFAHGGDRRKARCSRKLLNMLNHIEFQIFRNHRASCTAVLKNLERSKLSHCRMKTNKTSYLANNNNQYIEGLVIETSLAYNKVKKIR